jgi:hypothetical protein
MRFVLQSDKIDFAGYTLPLEHLERSFRKAGLEISFLADCSPAQGKKIHIRRGGRITTTICIEGDSVAQAIKDVAGAVPL